MEQQQHFSFMPPPTGADLRNKGISQVSDNNDDWMEACFVESARAFGVRSANDTFTGEDIRFHCQETVGSPKHSNAWGALINHLIRNGIIVPTGNHRPMRDLFSHARSTPLYRAA